MAIEVPDNMPVEFDFRHFKVYLNSEGVVLIVPPAAAEQMAAGIENGRSRFIWNLSPKNAGSFKRLDRDARKHIPEDV